MSEIVGGRVGGTLEMGAPTMVAGKEASPEVGGAYSRRWKP